MGGNILHTAIMDRLPVQLFLLCLEIKYCVMGIIVCLSSFLKKSSGI